MKNVILKLITGLAFIGIFTAGSFIGTQSRIPAIIFVVCLGWIGMFALANKEYERVQIQGGRNE